MDTKKVKMVLSVDAETDGLWGLPFAIGAVCYSENGVEISRFEGMSTYMPKNEWVLTNVVPKLGDMTMVGDTDDLLQAFAKYYQNLRELYDVTVLWHMGHVVEAYLFRLLVEKGYIGEWDAPYTPIELSVYLEMYGYAPDSVDAYLEEEDIEVDFDGATHNPLYDCIAAYKVWRNL